MANRFILFYLKQTKVKWGRSAPPAGYYSDLCAREDTRKNIDVVVLKSVNGISTRY